MWSLLWDVPVEMLSAGACLGQHSHISITHTRGSTFSTAEQLPITVPEQVLAAAWSRGSCGSSQQGYMFLQNPKMSMATTCLLLSLEGGWKGGKAIPALYLPPRMRFVCRYFFVFHLQSKCSDTTWCKELLQDHRCFRCGDGINMM